MKRVSSNASVKLLVWYRSGNLITGIEVGPRIYVPFSAILSKANAYIKTVSSGSDIIIDINKNGNSIFTEAMTIVEGNNTISKTSFSNSDVNEDDYFTIDIDQVGSTTTGADLTVELEMLLL